MVPESFLQMKSERGKAQVCDRNCRGHSSGMDEDLCAVYSNLEPTLCAELQNKGNG